MKPKDTEHPEEPNPREDDRNEQVGTPVPDPEDEPGTAEDDPGAD
jgi:hypothetical protein